MRIAILGYGIEGKSAEKFLKREVRGVKLEVRDIKIQGKDYLKNLDDFDVIVRSPGISYLLPEIQHVIRHAARSNDRASAKKAVVTSATKLFFKNAKGILVGITGTKGKGTVATLLYKILRAAGKDVHIAGNIGRPMLDILPKLRKNSIAILELSSFQLQDLDISPHIAVVLDVSPDHLNYHRNFKEYLNAKAKIVGNHPPYPPPYEGGGRRGEVFYFPDNKYSKQIAQKGLGKKIQVLPNSNLKLRISGFHNLKNASMAACVARVFGVKENIIDKTISQFKGLPHRLEFVREINGVRFYNDSASTNPAATIAALKSFGAPKILIAGGQSKGLSFKPLLGAVKKSNVKLVILYGQNRNEIGSAVGRASPIIYMKNLKSIVKLAGRKARRGDIVLLSPASTAFDQFSGYEERGKYFKKLVNLL